MAIWHKPIDLASLNLRGKNTLIEWAGIEFTELGDDYMVARMPVDHRTKQPIGILHGGASCVLAESVGSTAGNCCVDIDKFYCVGLEINVNHIRSIKEGYVYGTAKPLHLGRSTQVWQIEMRNMENKMTAVSRLTMSVLAR